MAYSIEVDIEAGEFIKEQTPKHQRQIRNKIDTLKNEPRPPSSKLLKGSTELRRIRSGDFRIIYTVEDDKLVVVVVKVGDRKSIYKALQRLRLID